MRRCFSTTGGAAIINDVGQMVRSRFPVSRRDIPKLDRHSHPAVAHYSDFTVFTVPILKDSYSYVLVDETTKSAALIDPAEPDIVLKNVAAANIEIACIIASDHRDEHCAGNKALLEAYPKARVYGFDENIPGVTHLLRHGATFRVGNLRLRGLHTPGVTEGAAVYHLMAPRRPHLTKSPNTNPHSLLFSGQTLLVGGCGKFADRSEREMYHNLVEIIGALPSDTEIFCSRESAVWNLEFAESLFQGKDSDVSVALRKAKERRDAYEATVPGLLEDEYLYNPFMRVNHGQVMQAVGCGVTHPPHEVLRRIRDKRDVREKM